MFADRITILAGHFGSGKTEIAVNAALSRAARGDRIALADLDVVKPYFRSRSAREFLAEAGVTLVAPDGERLYADLPILLPQVRSLCGDPGARVILDVGGDDSGARILGALNDVLAGQPAAFLLVLNFRRPFTPDAASAVAMAREIEAAARLKVTGVVSNTHLMGETTPAVIREGHDLALQTAALLGVPAVGVAVEERWVPHLDRESLKCDVFPLRRVVKPPFEEGGYRVRKTGPVFKLA